MRYIDVFVESHYYEVGFWNWVKQVVEGHDAERAIVEAVSPNANAKPVL